MFIIIGVQTLFYSLLKKLNYDSKNTPGKIANVIVKTHIIENKTFQAFLKLILN
jgi:hypothetical protein